MNADVIAAQARAFVISVIRETWTGGPVNPVNPLSDYGYYSPRSINDLKARINEKRWHGAVIQTAEAQTWSTVSDVIASVEAAAS